jgi:transcriptional regulator with XRE-family HTH domain
MTQQQIAELLEVDPSMISRVESGDTPYDRAYLEVFAQAYGCEPWQLLIQDPNDSAWLYKFFLSLPEEVRRELFKIARNSKE